MSKPGPALNAYMKNYRATHPEYVAGRYEYEKNWRLLNHDKVVSQAAARAKDKYEMYKSQVFDHYGRVCLCCGESNGKFLTIDHINNDGKTHRKQPGATNMPAWLVRNGFPENLVQVLCWNCNLGKRVNGGVCPHMGDH